MSDSRPQRIQGLQLPTQHLETVSVWCALSSNRICGPVSTYGTVASGVYLNLLSDEFAPFLLGYGILMDSGWFQQDDARPHTSDAVLHLLHDVFMDRVLLKGYPALFQEDFSRTPTSPGLNPCDYFPWGYLENRVFQENLNTVPELKTAIHSEIEAICTQTLTKTLNPTTLADISTSNLTILRM
jgi:hypothetical protein